jgi:hypothetical protein
MEKQDKKTTQQYRYVVTQWMGSLDPFRRQRLSLLQKVLHGGIL